MANVTKAKAIQILKFNTKKNLFELSPEFQTILSSEEVKNCRIAVISIAGAFRTGKSFLLNFLLRYLYAEYDKNNSQNWMGTDNDSLNGFKWRGGAEKETTGIWMWSKIFTKVQTTGEKIGVMLIDTQGLFDETLTPRENVTLCSFSMLLSSVQMFNLCKQIQEDNLQNLQLFAEYARSVAQKSSDKLFQSMVFLIRDWCNTKDYNYGADGGKKYLANKLSATQTEELKSVRAHLISCYDHLNCFLMPFPGMPVFNSDKFKFTGQLQDIDSDFIDTIKELVPMYLSPENILLKTINGKKVLAEELFTHAETYLNHLNICTITAKTIYEASFEANILNAMIFAFTYYDDEMIKQIKNNKEFIVYQKMFEIHTSTAKAAIELFHSKTNLGDNQTRNDYEKKITSELEKKFLLFLAVNENKRAKTEEILKNVLKELEELKGTNIEQNRLLEDMTKKAKESVQREKDAIRKRNIGTAIITGAATIGAGAAIVAAAPLVLTATAAIGVGSALSWLFT